MIRLAKALLTHFNFLEGETMETSETTGRLTFEQLSPERQAEIQERIVASQEKNKLRLATDKLEKLAEQSWMSSYVTSARIAAMYLNDNRVNNVRLRYMRDEDTNAPIGLAVVVKHAGGVLSVGWSLLSHLDAASNKWSVSKDIARRAAFTRLEDNVQPITAFAQIAQLKYPEHRWWFLETISQMLLELSE